MPRKTYQSRIRIHSHAHISVHITPPCLLSDWMALAPIHLLINGYSVWRTNTERFKQTQFLQRRPTFQTFTGGLWVANWRLRCAFRGCVCVGASRRPIYIYKYVCSRQSMIGVDRKKNISRVAEVGRPSSGEIHRIVVVGLRRVRVSCALCFIGCS